MKKKWLPLIIITITIAYSPISTSISAFFSPEDKITNLLIEQIKQAKRSIYAAVYLICDHRVSDALITAKQTRNLDIKIIVDQLSVGRYGKAPILAQNGIEVYVFDPSYRSSIQQKKPLLEKNTAKPSQGGSLIEDRWWGNEAIMHHKFAIIDESTIITGSFNWTNAADKKNCENIVLIEKEKKISQQFCDYFARFLKNGSCNRYFPDRAAEKIQTELEKQVMSAIKSTQNETELFLALEKILSSHQKSK